MEFFLIIVLFIINMLIYYFHDCADNDNDNDNDNDSDDDDDDDPFLFNFF